MAIERESGASVTGKKVGPCPTLRCFWQSFDRRSVVEGSEAAGTSTKPVQYYCKLLQSLYCPRMDHKRVHGHATVLDHLSKCENLGVALPHSCCSRSLGQGLARTVSSGSGMRTHVFVPSVML
jgi:hypothetical protein